jgi:predicted signal transduction protein with EAL and GGDEF domain
VFVGASVGVTMFPDGADTYDTVVSRADSAMYQAKADGRGRFKVCQPSSSIPQKGRQT